MTVSSMHAINNNVIQNMNIFVMPNMPRHSCIKVLNDIGFYAECSSDFYLLSVLIKLISKLTHELFENIIVAWLMIRPCVPSKGCKTIHTQHLNIDGLLERNTRSLHLFVCLFVCLLMWLLSNEQTNKRIDLVFFGTHNIVSYPNCKDYTGCQLRVKCDLNSHYDFRGSINF